MIARLVAAEVANLRDAANTELKIIDAAQYLVDTWRRSSKRGPFARTVQQAEQTWSHLFASDDDRAIFRQVANAIRLGKGHASLNPKPLLQITRGVSGGRNSQSSPSPPA